VRFIRRLLTVLLSLTAATAGAHEVPDRVRIAMFAKPEGGHLLILVRMPANALIDFLLPTLEGGNWVDLANAPMTAQEGANVWIADMLSLSEDGTPLARPEVLAVRLSKVNDPSFGTFEDALSRVNGLPLPVETLALQEQLTVDALLRTPIARADGRFAFTPRFARLGVVVDTALTFLAPDGQLRAFNFQGDPETFQLNPTRRDSTDRFAKAAVAHFLGQLDYLMFALCVALTLPAIRPLRFFVVSLAAAQAAAMLALYAGQADSPTLRSITGVLLAALVVYMGIEAIVAVRGRRIALAMAGGLVLGAAWWFGLRPDLQFAGAHVLIAVAVFTVCAIATQSAVVGVFYGAAWIARRITRVPRATVILPAAVAIHLSWRQFLDRADGLALVSLYSPTGDPTLLVSLGAVGILILVAAGFLRARRRPHGAMDFVSERG
jgi:hypothetical protein